MLSPALRPRVPEVGAVDALLASPSTGDVGQGVAEVILGGRVLRGGVADLDILNVYEGSPREDTAGEGIVGAAGYLEALARSNIRHQGAGATRRLK